MPRKKPAAENEKQRITVSLPRKVVLMAEAYRHREESEFIPDFSALVARALISYAQMKHPDLLEETISHIRDNPEQFDGSKSKAAAIGFPVAQREDIANQSKAPAAAKSKAQHRGAA